MSRSEKHLLRNFAAYLCVAAAAVVIAYGAGCALVEAVDAVFWWGVR